MKNFHFILIFLSLILFSCNRQNEKVEYFNKIQGDWISQTNELNSNYRIFTFSFNDSLCAYMNPMGPFSNFKILNDTLQIIDDKIIPVYKGERNYHFYKKIQFKIAKLTDDLLYLTFSNKDSKEFFIDYKNKKLDTIKLMKVKPVSDFKIDKIGFYSSECYGSCPAMYLEIDSSGDFLFQGQGYTEKIGLFKGILDSLTLSKIFDNIKSIKLNELENSYTTSITDCQNCGVKLKTSKGIIECNVYGSEKEPIELRLLFHKLMELYKFTDFVQDSTVISQFEFKEFMYNGFPKIPESYKKSD